MASYEDEKDQRDPSEVDELEHERELDELMSKFERSINDRMQRHYEEEDRRDAWKDAKLPMNTATLVCYARAMWIKKMHDPDLGSTRGQRFRPGHVNTHTHHHAQLGALDEIAALMLDAHAFPEGIESAFAKLPEGSEAVFAMRQHFVLNALTQDISPREEELQDRNRHAARLDKVQVVQLGAGLDPLHYQLHCMMQHHPHKQFCPLEVFVVDQPDQLAVRSSVMRHAAQMLRARGNSADADFIEMEELCCADANGVRKIRHIPMVFGRPPVGSPLHDEYSPLKAASELLDKLQGAGWSASLPTMFVAVGLSYYLNERAITDLIRMVQIVNELRPKVASYSNALFNSLILDYATPTLAATTAKASEDIERAQQALKDMGEPIDFKTDDMTPLLHHHGAVMIRETSFLSHYTLVMREAAVIAKNDSRRLRFVEAAWQPPLLARHTGHFL